MSLLVTDGVNPINTQPGAFKQIVRSMWLPFGTPQSGLSAIFAANQCRFFGVENQFFRELTLAGLQVGGAGAGGALITIGLYDLNGNRLTSNNANPFDGTNVATAQSKALDTPIILSPGFYLLAWTSNDAAITMQNMSVASTTYVNTSTKQIRMGTFANASAGGLLPATSGVLTAVGLGNICACGFEA